MNATATFTYTMKYRPAGFCTCPKGFRFVASGTQEPLPMRPELPRSEHRFGVIEYDRELTSEEIATYEMTRL